MAKALTLSANISRHIGALHLRARFHLHAPWTVLFGPSGAGKSTLLRILSGLLTPDTGVVTLGNQIVCDTTAKINVFPRLRNIGLVMQEPALFPHLSAAQNVAFGLHGLQRDLREQRTLEALRLCHATSLAGRMPRDLSGGERQRVALARALAPMPQLLLLDEPFSALDASLKEQILANLTAWLAERQIPALYVSHDLAEAYQTGAEVILLENGEVQSQGAVEEVLAPHRARLLRHLGV